MSTCFELPLTPNYVRDWDFGMAVRELIQNGLDQQSVDAKSLFSVDYDPDTQKLKFTNARSRLKVNTLLLGRISKSNDEDTVGQFGEWIQDCRPGPEPTREDIHDLQQYDEPDMDLKI